MNIYIIEKDKIKTMACEKYFSQLTWLLKARAIDKDKKSLQVMCIKNGIYYATDGHRLHCFSPDIDNLPIDFNIPDGLYKVVSITKKQIVLNVVDDIQYPDIERVLDYKRYNGIKPFKGDFTHFIHHLYTSNPQVFNINYLKDSFIDDETLTFDRMGDGEISGLLFGNENQFAVVMPLRQ
jgi:hypothetical protein